MDANQWYQRGSNAHNAGDYATAIDSFEKVTQLVPHSFDAWWALASACMLHGSHLEMNHEYTKAHPYKIKAAESFERAAQVDASDSRASKARDNARVIRGAQEERRRMGLLK